MKRRRQSGFTLIEIMVAMTIFAFVMTSAMGAVLTMVDANQKSQALNAVMANLNSSLEAMSRNIRTGYDYQCFSDDGDPTESGPLSGHDCINGQAESGISFIPSNLSQGADANTRFYYLIADDQVWQYVTGDDTYTSLTGSDISIDIEDTYDDLVSGFYVYKPTNGQPRVFLKLKGTVNGREGLGASFYLQTTMAQRLLGL